MTTKTTESPTETDITAMTFEQLQAELKAIPAQQQKAIYCILPRAVTYPEKPLTT